MQKAKVDGQKMELYIDSWALWLGRVQQNVSTWAAEMIIHFVVDRREKPHALSGVYEYEYRNWFKWTVAISFQPIGNLIEYKN